MERKHLLEGFEESLLWTASQAERELLRFLATLRRHGSADTPLAPDVLAERFEVLWSRIGLFGEGQQGRILQGIPEIAATTRIAIETLQRTEAAVMSLEPDDGAGRRELLEQFQDLEQPLHKAVIAVTSFSIGNKSELHRNEKALLRQSILFSGGLLLSGGILIFLIIREKHTSSRLLKNYRWAEKELHEGEMLYQSLTEIAGVGIWQISTDDRILYINPAMRMFLEIDGPGETADEFSPSFLTPVDIEEMALEKANKYGGVPSTYEVEFVGKRGGRRNGLVAWAPLFSDDGQLRSLIGTFTDITEHKQAKKASLEAEEKYRRIFENAIEGIFQSTPEGRFISANPAMARILGFATPEALIGGARDIGYQIYVDPDDRQNILRLAAKGGSVSDFEVKLRHKDGNVIWVSENIRALKDVRGKVLYFEGTITDITERKCAEKNLRESETRYRTIANAIGETGQGIMVVDNDYTVRYMNEIMIDWFGDLTGKNCHATCADAEGPGPHCSLEQVIDKGETVRSQRNSGGRVLDIVATPIRNDDGTISRLEIIRDITERKRTEKALRESKEKFRQLAENIDAVFWMIEHGDERKVLYISPAYEAIWGRSCQSLYENPLSILDAIHPEDRERVIKDFEKQEQGDYDEEFRIVRPDGSIRWIRDRAYPIRDEEGRIYRMAGVAEDITQARLTSEQLDHSSKLATLGEMASGIAHELNQPLNISRMATEFLLMKLKGEKIDAKLLQRKLKTIFEQSDRMADIINHMRMYSRKENSENVPLDPRQSLSNAVLLIDKQFKATGIELKLEFPKDCRAVSGIPLRLEQVVLNLFSNARDAIMEKIIRQGVDKSSFIPVIKGSIIDDKRSDSVVIAVTDNGGGIPEENLDMIFESFFTTKMEGKGTGIGLSISKDIINKMNGRLEARNMDDGCRFEISLPVFPDHPVSKEEPMTREISRNVPVNAKKSGLRVLVVDDEELSVLSMAEYLEDKGCEVFTAGNGQKAMKLFQSHRPDAVVTDLRMPVMDGDEFIKWLRKQAPEIPIIVATGHTNIGEDEEIVADGASKVLKKPIKLRELAEILSNLTNRKVS